MDAFAEATGGRLEPLFNDAGVGGGGWLEAVPREVSRRIADMNPIGLVNGIDCGLPPLKRRRTRRHEDLGDHRRSHDR